MSASNSFYDELTPYYHLIYPDWEGAIERQGAKLDAIVREVWGQEASSILDVSCGIGTQAIGLAQLGYQVTASDLSPEEVQRARKEADRRDLAIDFTIADMRHVAQHHDRTFDVMISCDNSIPHLLSDEEIRSAFCAFFQCTRPGGGCLISVRDYEQEDLSQRQIKPYGIREADGARWLLWQVWEPHGRTYDVTLYLVEDRGQAECRTHAFRTTYYAVGIPRLIALMNEAGFEDVRRIDGRFFQPIVVGRRAD